MKYWIFGCLLVFLMGCQRSERKPAYVAPENPVFVHLSTAATGLDFRDQLPRLDSLYLNFPADSARQENFLRLAERLLGAGGVGAGDLNNDGLPDLFFTSSNGENRLYLNRGGWRFEDVTKAAGLGGNGQWSAGVSLADVNADGWLDLYVCHFGANARNELFIHSGTLNEQGVPIFTEQAQQLGLQNERQAVQAVFFDYDLDGDLDCLVANNFQASPDSTKEWPNGPDRLYQNEKGVFIDVSEKAGFRSARFSTGIAVADFNGDQWPDVALSRDFPENDVVYINQQKGAFAETYPFAHTPERSLGLAAADLDNDAYTDLFTASVLSDDAIRRRTQARFGNNQQVLPTVGHNTLQRNEGQFSERAWLAGVAATDVSHSGLILDLDTDGWKDLFVPNGLMRDTRNLDFLEKLSKAGGRLSLKTLLRMMPSVTQSSFAFLNQKDFAFENQAVRLGLGEPSFSNGAAYADLDNDGDLDLIINQMGKPASLYRNDFDEAQKIQSLKIKFKGPAGNPFGYGAEIRVFTGELQQKIILQPNQGYQSSQEPILQVGLGSAQQADSIVVYWPGFKMQVLRAVTANQTLVMDASEARDRVGSTMLKTNRVLTDVTGELFPKEVRHQEDSFDDLLSQPYLPRTLSKEGPKLAQGDVNGDGLVDVFLTGVQGQTGQLLLQTPKGTFLPSNQPAFLENQYREEVAALFLDVEGDKDLDLVVASGGNQSADSSWVRLYLNDGKGNFTLATDQMPTVSLNASCLAAADFDKDGDLDLFVGARSVPGSYGVTPKSYLFRNEKGVFKEDTPEVLSRIGLVTDATWQDLDSDGMPDLLVVGEWMPITIFYNRSGKFTYSHNQTIPNSEGWWTALQKADLDGDGDMDFVVGNWGLNSEYKASYERPLYLQINDFDRNNSIDALLTLAERDGEQYPLDTKDEWKQQLPGWNSPFPSNSAFAEKSFHQLITNAQRRGTLEKKVVEFRSSALINEGRGNFTLRPLPPVAQQSPVFAIAIHDFTKDGKPDILLGGNLWGMPPSKGRLDASRGTLLVQESSLIFREHHAGKSFFNGQVRGFTLVRVQQKYRLFVGRNKGKLQAFAF
ncbi:hypothetical protein BWI97_05175 [Siphonobacter sp. BAB-5405]|uniref:VCBS repeat-containing protein n=1 Tax=Siphonobacter sp. BAB-5405 TaxID=1864825 RepID=UPI000C80DC7E|nr:VCBS repeat-containing protein [Siphonobacter sp. BAB-5405]PMD98550.1 hypothetical protein BWI97_05175 [Siphonobacter sp. BAB-5405]